MIALIELVDEFGEAIEADLAEHYGDSLRDFLLGIRPPGEALRKIAMLPAWSRTGAHLQARPAQPGNDYARPKPEPWRRFHGVNPATVAAWDVFDAIFAAIPGIKKPPKHPRTSGGASSSRGRRR